MSDIPSILVRVLVGLIDGIMGIFAMLHWAERQSSRKSLVGESRLDRDARNWQEWILASWYWIALALLIVGGLVGATIWGF